MFDSFYFEEEITNEKQPWEAEGSNEERRRSPCILMGLRGLSERSGVSHSEVLRCFGEFLDQLTAASFSL